MIHDRVFGRLRAPAGVFPPGDRYCAEAAVLEPLLDIPAGLLPGTTTDLDAYLRTSSN